MIYRFTYAELCFFVSLFLFPSAYNSFLSSLQSRSRSLSRLNEETLFELRRRLNLHYRQSTAWPTKAKRLVKEMYAYWKRHEKEVVEWRKRSEREEIERIRREMENREAERQKKKLEFLLTQTELYSHFIGSKMGKTTERNKKNGTRCHLLMHSIV